MRSAAYLIVLLVTASCVRTGPLGEDCGLPREGDGRWEPAPQCDDGLVCSSISNLCVCPGELIEYGDDCVSPGTGQVDEFCPWDDRYCSEGLVCMRSPGSAEDARCRPAGSAAPGAPCSPGRGDCAESWVCDLEPARCIEPGSIVDFYDCRDDRSCASGLTCRPAIDSGRPICLPLGEAGERCDSDMDCVPDLPCEKNDATPGTARCGDL